MSQWPQPPASPPPSSSCWIRKIPHAAMKDVSAGCRPGAPAAAATGGNCGREAPSLAHPQSPTPSGPSEFSPRSGALRSETTGAGPQVPVPFSRKAGSVSWPCPRSGTPVFSPKPKVPPRESQLPVTASQSPVEVTAALCRVPSLTQSLPGAQKCCCPCQGLSHLPKLPFDPWF